MPALSSLPSRGFTLIGLLFLIAGLGVAMAALGTLWQTASQREKERELLFIGDQYRQAIESFWKAQAGAPRLPINFNELLADPRFPNKRHLRRAYRDPFTGSQDWGVVNGATGGIAGIYSLSGRTPLKRDGFPARYSDFSGAQSYKDWVFASSAEVKANPEAVQQ